MFTVFTPHSCCLPLFYKFIDLTNSQKTLFHISYKTQYLFHIFQGGNFSILNWLYTDMISPRSEAEKKSLALDYSDHGTYNSAQQNIFSRRLLTIKSTHTFPLTHFLKHLFTYHCKGVISDSLESLRIYTNNLTIVQER